MTNPMPMMPNVELGNVATDLSSAVGSFAKGLQAERARQRDEALSRTIAQVQLQRAMRPNYSHIVVQSPNGPVHAVMDMDTQEVHLTNSPAADPQMAIPTQNADGSWGLATAPRNRPGEQPTPVQFAPGTGARGPAPIPVTSETPTGPRTVMTPRVPNSVAQGRAPVQSGQQPVQQPVQGQSNQQPVQPNPGISQGIQQGGQGVPTRATEADERRARAALDMVQGKYEMRQALTSASTGRNPQEMRQNAQNAYDEAARYISALQVGEGIPVIGNFVNELINQSQSVLSPAAARYFSGFMHGAAARAFSNGGTALTKQEIDYSLMSLSPKPFEDAATTQMRDRLWSGVIVGATAGNNAWQRYRATAKQLGYDDSNVDLTAPPPPQQDINPRTGLPMRIRRH